MALETLITLAGDNVVVTFCVVTLLVFTTVKTIFSDALSTTALGEISRWMRSLQSRAVELDSREQEIHAYESLEEEVGRLTDQLRAFDEQLRDAIDYIVIVQRRHRELEMWASEHGLELPPPPIESFREFRDRKGRDSPS